MEIKFRFVYRHRQNYDYKFQYYTLEEIMDGKYTEYKLLHDGYEKVDVNNFIGLQDDKGTDIYEGDMLKYLSGIAGTQDQEDIITEVIYLDGAYMDGVTRTYIGWCDWEVIGKKYEYIK